MRSFLLFVLLTVPVFAEPPKAVIKGPKEVLAGTLLFLSNEEAVGDNKVWIIDEELKQQSAACGSNIFFAIPKPGKYKFGLIVANKEAQIDYTYHSVTVVSYSGTTPPPPDQPSPPSTSPLPLQEIRKTSNLGVVSLNDPTTTNALSQALRQLLPSLSNSLPEAKAQVSATIETVFLFRDPVNRTKDWLNKWRKPVQNAIEKRPPSTAEEYKQAIQAVLEGLTL